MSKKKPLRKRLSDTRITRDKTLQPREQMDQMTVAEYEADLKAGVKFPPVVVFYDDNLYWLADGYHRVEAKNIPSAVGFATHKPRTRYNEE